MVLPKLKGRRNMDTEDDAEEAEFRTIKWKPNDKGIRSDACPRTKSCARIPTPRAYLAMRSNLGRSHPPPP